MRGKAAVSLYDQLGGEGTISSAVSGFFDRALADDSLAPWFAGLARLRQLPHLEAYLAVALDGPERYTGQSMRAAHAGLGATGAAFDAILSHLCAALADAGAPPEAVALARRRLTALRPVIVERPGS